MTIYDCKDCGLLTHVFKGSTSFCVECGIVYTKNKMIHLSDFDDTTTDSVTKNILDERQNDWGDANTTHSRIAETWSGILGTTVTAYQVALCMTGLKLVRADLNPDDPDSLIDAAGYTHIAQNMNKREQKDD